MSLLGPDGKPTPSGIVDVHGREAGLSRELAAVQVFLSGQAGEPTWLDSPDGGPRMLGLGYGCQHALLYVQGKGPAEITWRSRPPMYATVFLPEPEVRELYAALGRLLRMEGRRDQLEDRVEDA